LQGSSGGSGAMSVTKVNPTPTGSGGELFRFTRQIPYWSINRFIGQRIAFGQYNRIFTKARKFNSLYANNIWFRRC
jgi:hypothetical protein